jgi:hypothetical protein
VQISGLGSFSGGRVVGLQLAGLFTLTRGPLSGVQLSGLVAGAAGGRGAQVSGVANVSDGDFRGVQLTGVANVARTARGLQMAGVFNGASTMDGLQLSVVNVGGDVHGAQIGVVNVARRVKGTQIGVVNIADDMEGAPVGLVSLVRTGIHEAELASSDVGATVVSAVLGSRRIYGRLGFGVMAAGNDVPGLRTDPTVEGSRGHYLTQWGMGGRFPIDDRWFVDVEAGGTQFFRASDFHQENAVAGSLRVLAGVHLAPHLALVLGPTYTASVGWNGTDLAAGRDVAGSVFRDGATTVRLFPGLVLGLRV